ncbi:MAG: hydrogenase maturation protease [Deltaproteobacteria bacterium]|nr:hydrogenase maturation protease [Deltaproteobacteria bacterium]
MDNSSTVLLIGYGNPGRLDDGLGPAVAEAIEKKALKGVTVDSDYQLTVEDADAISKHDYVIFVDADTSGAEPFWIEEVDPKAQVSFSSHSISPNALMDMSNNLLGGRTKGYLMGIRGYEFNEFCEKLSDKAKSNMNEAMAFLEVALKERQFENYVAMYKK